VFFFIDLKNKAGPWLERRLACREYDISDAPCAQRARLLQAFPASPLQLDVPFISLTSAVLLPGENTCTVRRSLYIS
jgi:hypothetical protein